MLFFFFKQKTAYEMRISDWSSDVCSSDLVALRVQRRLGPGRGKRTILIVLYILLARPDKLDGGRSTLCDLDGLLHIIEVAATPESSPGIGDRQMDFFLGQAGHGSRGAPLDRWSLRASPDRQIGRAHV